MKRSQSSFLGSVWPVIGPMIGGGRVVSMEASKDSELRSLFDTAGGVDAWQVLEGGAIYGVASRVQPSGIDFSTFTVRLSRDTASRTEWQKLYEAVTAGDGRVYPRWFVQAYMDKQSTSVISVAAIHTDELVMFIKENCHVLRDVGYCVNARFWKVSWDRLCDSCGSLVVSRPSKSSDVVMLEEITP
jgi:hypothetical protein